MKPMHKKLFVMNALIFTMLALSMIGQVAQPSTAQAAETNDGKIQYTLLEPLPCIPGDGVTCQEGKMQTSVNFETYVQYMFNLIIAFAAVAAVLMIVWGGFKYVTSDSFLGKNEGKKVIMQALQGLLLVLCSYLILRTIDPRLVAIPSTIVTPLEIKCASDTNILVSDPKCASVTGDFFTQLSQEASILKYETAELLAEREKAKARTTVLKNELDQLIEQRNRLSNQSGSEAKQELDNIDAKIQLKRNEITYQQNIALVKADSASIKSSLNSIVNSYVYTDSGTVSNIGNWSNKTIDLEIQNVNSRYNHAIKIISQTENTIESKTERLNITDMYNETRANLILIKYSSDLIDNSYVEPSEISRRMALLETTVKKNIIDETKFTDESKKAAIQKKYDAVMKTLKLKKDSYVPINDFSGQ